MTLIDKYLQLKSKHNYSKSLLYNICFYILLYIIFIIILTNLILQFYF
jgi:hypothetical protein